MKLFRNIFSQLHTFILWLLLSLLFWGWIFTILTDTDKNHKVVVYVDAYELHDRELAIRLEEEKPEGIKMIKVRDFSYDVVENGDMEASDIYIVRESKLKEMLRDNAEALACIPASGGYETYEYNDQIYAIRVYDGQTRTGPAAGRYILYWPDQEPDQENCYLCFNAASLHLLTNEGAVDNAAWEVAEDFLAIEP